eukprot:1079008-Rhodomonas_salina.3
MAWPSFASSSRTSAPVLQSDFFPRFLAGSPSRSNRTWTTPVRIRWRAERHSAVRCVAEWEDIEVDTFASCFGEATENSVPARRKISFSSSSTCTTHPTHIPQTACEVSDGATPPDMSRRPTKALTRGTECKQKPTPSTASWPVSYTHLTLPTICSV